MTTLIEVRTLAGNIFRCASRCYEAASDSKTCTCICAGTNHGVGLEAAKANVRDNHEKLCKSYLYGITDYEIMINVNCVNQLPLPINFTQEIEINPKKPGS